MHFVIGLEPNTPDPKEPRIPPTFACPDTLPVLVQEVRDSQPFAAVPTIPPTPLKSPVPVEFVAVMVPVFMQEVRCPSLLQAIPPNLSWNVILTLLMQLVTEP